MERFADIIGAFGIAAAAKVMGLPESHVRVMKARDSIPPEYWGALIEAAPQHDIPDLTWQRLKSLRTNRFEAVASGQAS